MKNNDRQLLNDLPADSLIKPLLIANKAEVKRMCITEYDEERAFAEQIEEYSKLLRDLSETAFLFD